MILKYAVDGNGNLIYVGQEKLPEKTFCFYCEGELIAQTEHLLGHSYFAHRENPCSPSEREGIRVDLPLFDDFSLNLSVEEIQLLRWFATTGNFIKPNNSWQQNVRVRDQLIEKSMIVSETDSYLLTKQGRIPSGQLPMRLFDDEQRRLIFEAHRSLEQDVINAENQFDRDLAIADLTLFRAQWKRALSGLLYLLKVEYEEGTLHKIGVTWKPISDCMAEVEEELAPLLNTVRIKPMQTLAHQGTMLGYIMYYFAQRQKFFGPAAYLEFNSQQAALEEFIELGDHELSELEIELLANEGHDFGLNGDKIIVTVYEARRGEYKRRVSLKKYEITCKQCGRLKTLWRYPGRPPSLCSEECERIYKRERDRDKIRERVRRHRAAKTLD